MSNRADPEVLPLANAHYSRQSPESPQFVPPGRCIVLKTACRRAAWTTSWPYAEFTKHAWAGAWINSLFRSEGAGLASELIREAVAATRSLWPDVPDLGLVTFVDASMVRHKRDPGRCYLRAGFRAAGLTKGGLLAFQMLPAEMPAPVQPRLELPECA
jgi:hypothetical protein